MNFCGNACRIIDQWCDLLIILYISTRKIPLHTSKSTSTSTSALQQYRQSCISLNGISIIETKRIIAAA